MKISRSQPCPCGSGKKYKRCCLGHQQFTSSPKKPNISRLPTSIQNEYEEMEEIKRLYQAMQHLRTMELKKLEHIKSYKKARDLHQEIISSMVEFYDNGNFQQSLDLDAIRKHENKHEKRPLEFIDISFDFNSPLGEHAFFDMQIYKLAPNANCMTEVFLEKKRFRT